MRHSTATNIEALMTDDNKIEALRLVDFHPLHPALDPAHQMTHAFAAKAYIQNIPTTITNTTPAPTTTGNARKYPDKRKMGESPR